MKRLLLIDFSNLYYRGAYAFKGLSYDGLDTSGIYGYQNQLVDLINRFEPTRMVVCADSPPYVRAKIVPEYKADRVPTDIDDNGEFYKHVRHKGVSVYISQLMGLQVLYKRGMEADDLIAALVKRYKRRFKQIIISSNDTDLYQLLGRNVSIWKGAKKGMYTLQDFSKEFDIAPARWPEVVAWSGGHNNLPSISGVGIKSAVKLVKIEEPRKFITNKNLEVVRRNLQLAQLPFSASLKVGIPLLRGYKESTLVKELAVYGIKFTREHREALQILEKMPRVD